ncbi:RICIN domain-containing protein [Actinoplanes philippinensis]|uniref:RICIN domain-containing protein n=1 Tax=Actinoplanes philippinensis TaxID=35752 RepID=UPI0033E9833E
MIDLEMIVPDGWAQIPAGSTSAADRARIIDELVRGHAPADAGKAGSWQRALRHEVTAAVDEAGRHQARTVLLPIGDFDGVRLPGSLFVAVVEDVEEGTAPEQLFASVLAGAGADGTYLEIGGAQAVRVSTVSSSGPAENRMPSRQVKYYVAHPRIPGAYGLVTFTAVSDGDVDADAVQAVVLMFDAVVGTLRWEQETAATPAAPATETAEAPAPSPAATPGAGESADEPTEVVAAPPPVVPSRRSRRGRPVVLGVVLALAVLTGAGGLAARRAAGAAEPETGNRVSAQDVRILVGAASSCTALTAPRLAGQVMVASNFGDQPVAAMSGGGAAGVAALTPAQWQENMPWEGARITDREAAVTALAHHMCRLVGQARTVNLDEDPWRVALAAHRLGMEPVIAAGGVPDAADEYVTTVERYANWYALQPGFAGQAVVPSPSPVPTTGDTVVPVPATYMPAIAAAGKSCPDMPPARIAAQIMATSGFDPNKLGAAGEQGIAQFPPRVWASTVKAAPGRSPWDPAVAIPALGRTMCELIKKNGGYTFALAAFTRGDRAAAVSDLAERVSTAQTQYAKDSRLQPVKKPSAPSSAPSSARPSRTTTGPTPAAPGRTNQPAVKGAGASGTAYGPYFVLNLATGMCVDVPNYQAGSVDGPVNQFPCAKTGDDNQEWTFEPRRVDAGGSQLYWIRNVDDGYCIDPPGNGAVAERTSLNESNCFDDDNQYFRLEPRTTSGGFAYYWLRNSASDMCLDVNGDADGGADTRLSLFPCKANDDHEWALVEKSEW